MSTGGGIGAGYKFFCIRHPEGQPRQAGVGLAFRTTLLSLMVSQPHGISPRIMTMHLQLEHGHSITAYAPTLLAADDHKEAFYDCLDSIIRSVPFRHRLLLLGDFSAHVGRDIVTWPKVLGRHSVGRENFNDTLLLETCAKHELVITITPFQMARKYKTT